MEIVHILHMTHVELAIMVHIRVGFMVLKVHQIVKIMVKVLIDGKVRQNLIVLLNPRHRSNWMVINLTNDPRLGLLYCGRGTATSIFDVHVPVHVHIHILIEGLEIRKVLKGWVDRLLIEMVVIHIILVHVVVPNLEIGEVRQIEIIMVSVTHLWTIILLMKIVGLLQVRVIRELLLLLLLLLLVMLYNVHIVTLGEQLGMQLRVYISSHLRPIFIRVFIWVILHIIWNIIIVVDVCMWFWWLIHAILLFYIIWVLKRYLVIDVSINTSYFYSILTIASLHPPLFWYFLIIHNFPTVPVIIQLIEFHVQGLLLILMLMYSGCSLTMSHIFLNLYFINGGFWNLLCRLILMMHHICVVVLT